MKRFSILLPLALTCIPAYAMTATQRCQPIAEAEVLALFDRWNASLKTGDPAVVAGLYDSNALLLPTVSKVPRLTTRERIDYFSHFLADSPAGKLDSHNVSVGCNNATLAGLYTFDFAKSGKQVAARYTFIYNWNGDQWFISHHHSSLLPAD